MVLLILFFMNLNVELALSTPDEVTDERSKINNILVMLGNLIIHCFNQCTWFFRVRKSTPHGFPNSDFLTKSGRRGDIISKVG